MTPWYCGYCSRWNRGKDRICPYCGRSARGRLCRRCKEPAPKDAAYCGQCGGDKLIEPANARPLLPVPVRLALAGVGAVGLYIGITLAAKLLTPLLIVLGRQALQLLYAGALYVVLFWLVTGLLPEPWRPRVRGAAWWLLRALFRFVRNLFS